MRWPWVNRARFEDLQQRLAASESERKELSERLIEAMAELGSSVTAAEQKAAESTEPEKPNFSTPFDRIERNFDQTFKGKQIPAKFKARA